MNEAIAKLALEHYKQTGERLQREFFLQWGTDVATAQALGRAEADELRVKITGGVE